MGTRVSHSGRRLTEAGLFLTLVIVTCGVTSNGQLPSTGDNRGSARITEWEDDVSGVLHFLHVMFPDINPKSKLIIASNRDWGHAPGRLGSFAIYICNPDFPTRQQEPRRDFFTHDDTQCSVLNLGASYLRSGSQFGPVPAWLNVWRPALRKRWNNLAVVLLAHSEWSEPQVEEAMKAAGVKYGADRRDDVIGIVHNTFPQLEPFFGKLTLDSIDYSAPRRTEEKELLPPVWIVKAHPSGQDKTKPWTSYIFTFNVFDGAFEGQQASTELPESKPRASIN